MSSEEEPVLQVIKDKLMWGIYMQIWSVHYTLEKTETKKIPKILPRHHYLLHYWN